MVEERETDIVINRKNDSRDRIIQFYRNEIEMIKKLNRNFETVNIKIEQLHREKETYSSNVEKSRITYEERISS